ncbi:MAG: Hsp20/alpha crystallin family protein [bacterium]|nr:Hsp20/alpha crystallin family protein [bacterium]
MAGNSKSFFERLTGGITNQDEEVEEYALSAKSSQKKEARQDLLNNEEEIGQLTVDMYQTPSEIIIQTMVSGVKQEDIDVSVTQDMINIKGKRQRTRELSEENYYYKELYWGSFSRSIMLPQEIDPDQIDATLKHGILTIRLPKVNKEKIQKIKIKSE